MFGSREEAWTRFSTRSWPRIANFGRSRAPAAVRPWLFVIARNRCISVLPPRAQRIDHAHGVPAGGRAGNRRCV
jgi:DNA-directed RNA polymerase specialized sigma24 family protein